MLTQLSLNVYDNLIDRDKFKPLDLSYRRYTYSYFNHDITDILIANGAVRF